MLSAHHSLDCFDDLPFKISTQILLDLDIFSLISFRMVKQPAQEWVELEEKISRWLCDFYSTSEHYYREQINQLGGCLIIKVLSCMPYDFWL